MKTPSSLLRHAAWITMAGAVMLATLPVRGADKRIVLIAGKPSHPPGMHEFRAGCLLFQKALAVDSRRHRAGLRPRLAGEDGGRRARGRQRGPRQCRRGADLRRRRQGSSRHPGRPLKIIEALAAKGVGLGFAHYGVEVPTGAPGDAMHRLIGGFYETKCSVNPMWKPPFDKLPTHPMTRGVGPFATHDEWYFNMRWSTDRGREGPDHPDPRGHAERRGSQGSLRLPQGSLRSHRRRQRQSRDDDVGVRTAGRRARIRLHWRTHARQLGRSESAQDHAERAALDRESRRAGARVSRTGSPPTI